MTEILIPSKKYGDRIALVDAEDADRVLEHTWSVNHRDAHLEYPYTNSVRQVLGRFIMQPEPHLRVIYVNYDRFDCRRENLRVVQHFESTMHRSRKVQNETGFRGVIITHGRFVATINANSTRHYLGCFEHAEDAAIAYDLAAYKFFGETAITNERLGLL